MLKTIFTLDYEIHGNGEGCPHKLMVEPTARLLDLFDEYGAKLTIMADVAEILKFREYRDAFGRDDYHYEAIVAQLKDAIRRGHDVQLHLHCSYFNARFENGKWVQDWKEYNFAGLSEERATEVIGLGKQFLEEQLCAVDPTYKCYVFRAANWAVSPSRNVVRALVNNGFKIDTSVFKYGRREGVVSFDYSNAPSELIPWLVDENDICRKNDAGKLLEVPIYCELRSIAAFASLHRIYRAYSSSNHRFSQVAGAAGPVLAKDQSSRRFTSLLMTPFRRHAWKADFNQCTGSQLSRALRRTEARFGTASAVVPFVLIGHSKLFTRSNERSLSTLLRFIAEKTSRFRFGTFDKNDFAKDSVARLVNDREHCAV